MRLAVPIALFVAAALFSGCGSSDADPSATKGGGGAGGSPGGGTGATPSGGSGGVSSGGGGAGTGGGTSDASDDAFVDASDAALDSGSCPPPTTYSHAAPFTPTPAAPTFHADISMPSGLTFAKIQVDVDFVRGPWASPAPSSGGMSNIFWLHRGALGKHWLNNAVGYLNFKGHSNMELSDNLGITDPAIWEQAISGKVTTAEGSEYHVTSVYDAAGHKYWFRVLQGASELLYREGVPLLDTVDGWDSWKANGTPGFFVEMGNAAWDGTGGPEVPTYGWVYSNLLIQFFPPCN